MSIHELLYANWLKRLAALKAEAAKHDWSQTGQAAYDVAFAEAKQAYNLLADEELRLYDAGMKAVYEPTQAQNAR